MSFDLKLLLLGPFLVPVLDVVFYILSFQWLKWFFGTRRGAQSVAVGEATETHGAPRRSPESPDVLVESTETLYSMIQKGIREYSPKTALVSRKYVEMKKLKETDRFPSKIYKADDDLEEISYKELGDLISSFGAGLRALGMEPVPQLKPGQSIEDVKGSFVMVIFEDTCKQWTIGLHGAASQSMTVATCYATLGDEAVISSVNETGATALLLNWKKAVKFSEMSAQMPTLKTIIASTYEMPEDTATPVAKKGSRISIVSFDDLIALGKKEQGRFPPVPPKSSDVAVIMYTSGSTGKPKGVVMKHSVSFILFCCCALICPFFIYSSKL